MKKKRRRILVFIALIALIGALISVLYGGKEIEADIAVAGRGQIQKVIKETGVIKSDDTVIVTSHFAGEIEDIAVSDGDYVSAGDLLLLGNEEVARLELKSIKAQRSGLKAAFLEAKDTADKNKILYNQGALSLREYESSAALEKELESQLFSLEYSMESLLKSINNHKIKAPASGTITEVYVKKGEYASIGTNLFEISNLDNLYVKADLIAHEAIEVDVGDEVFIYEGGKGKTSALSGVVKSISQKAKEKTSGLGVVNKRVGVEIKIESASNLLLESDVEIEIAVCRKDDVLCIPKSAIFEMENDNYVFVLDRGLARVRKIVMGLEGNNFVEIISGLTEGETVIRTLANDIEDGVRVKQRGENKKRV